MHFVSQQFSSEDQLRNGKEPDSTLVSAFRYRVFYTKDIHFKNVGRKAPHKKITIAFRIVQNGSDIKISLRISSLSLERK